MCSTIFSLLCLTLWHAKWLFEITWSNIPKKKPSRRSEIHKKERTNEKVKIKILIKKKKKGKYKQTKTVEYLINVRMLKTCKDFPNVVINYYAWISFKLEMKWKQKLTKRSRQHLATDSTKLDYTIWNHASNNLEEMSRCKILNKHNFVWPDTCNQIRVKWQKQPEIFASIYMLQPNLLVIRYICDIDITDR